MSFEHSRANYLRIANDLIKHLQQTLETPSGRKEWTEGNFGALRSFPVSGLQMSSYPKIDNSRRSGLRGQFLWDFMGCSEEEVILIAESEWNADSVELKHDFEKLLYTRCPIKLMMCGRWAKEGKEIADELNAYARTCSSNYSCGEVFILYCVGWDGTDGERNDQVFSWQVDGEVAIGKKPFNLEAIEPNS